MPKIANRAGVTPEDIDAARVERDRLREEHASKLEAAKASLKERKDANDGTLPVTAEVMEQVEELFAEADKLGDQADQAARHLARLQGTAYGNDPQDRMPAEEAARRGYGAGATVGAGLSLSRRLFADEEFLAAFQADRENGNFSRMKALRGVSLLDDAETARLLGPSNPSLAATFDGSPLVPDDQRVFPPVDLPQRQVQILDLITIGSTDSDTIDYAEETTQAVNEGGAAPGVALPESNIVVEARTVAVVRRGTLLPVPEANLRDQGQLRTWLNGKLTRGVRRGTENQVLGGDGLGQNFEGIRNRAGIGAYARPAGEAKADSIHKGMTIVRIAYEDEPDAIAFRPETLQDLILAKDGNGAYLNTDGPFGGMPTGLWGKRAVVSTALQSTANVEEVIVGFWPEATMWIRQGVELREFDQHADFAAKSLVLIRVEYRAAFKVLQPKAFAVVDLNETL